MLKIRLLHAVCSVAMLAAVPAFAQSNTQGSTPAPAGQQAMPGNSSASDSAATDNKDGLGVSGHGQRMHRTAMTHRDRAMHGAKTDKSQDSTIDQLNDQSYQAAQKGQTFAGNGSDAGSGSGGMNNMSGSGAHSGGMSGGGMSGGGMSGSGMSGGGMSGGGMSGSGAAGNGMSGGGAAGGGAGAK